MANPEHLKILKQGVQAWNKWAENPDLYLDQGIKNLSSADLSGLNLDGVDFTLTDLSHASMVASSLKLANLYGAILFRANLAGAQLFHADLCFVDSEEANFESADFSGSDLNYTKLIATNLSRTTLYSVNFCNATFANVDLSYARVSDTLFCGVDLREAKGLETIIHTGPSSIDVGTIYRSGGKIPEVFLRGTGIPESFIVNIKSFVTNASPITFYSCFISYSSKDQEFAMRLHSDLQNNGVRCWFASEDLKIGAKLRPSFDEAIHLHDKVMVILSESSVKSSWVEKEIETALEKERQQNRTVLFPIRLDDAVMETNEAWAADIRRTRHIGEFRNFKNHNS